MLNSLDLVIIAVFAFVVVVETKRGFGRAIFDFAALLVAVRGAHMLTDPLAGAVKLAANPSTNQAIIYGISFLIIGGVLVFLGKLVYDTTLVSAETFDALLGAICGIGVGIILCHALTRTLALAAGPYVIPTIIANSALGSEFLNFESYHRLLETMYGFGREE